MLIVNQDFVDTIEVSDAAQSAPRIPRDQHGPSWSLLAGLVIGSWAAVYVVWVVGSALFRWVFL
jgi:hypothetical protein